jgi:hypothetical protein
VTVQFGPRAALGAAAVAIVAIAVPVVVARHGDASVPTVKVAPLTATDRRVLTAVRPLIEALPTAIAQVPATAADVAGAGVTPEQASTIVAASPALVPLTRAVAAPKSVTAPLIAAYDAVLAGRAVPDAGGLASSLESLQTIEGDIVPAVRLVAAHRGHRLSAAGALSAIERDARQRDVALLVADWQEVYGSVTLLEQYAAS